MNRKPSGYRGAIERRDLLRNGDFPDLYKLFISYDLHLPIESQLHQTIDGLLSKSPTPDLVHNVRDSSREPTSTGFDVSIDRI